MRVGASTTCSAKPASTPACPSARPSATPAARRVRRRAAAARCRGGRRAGVTRPCEPSRRVKVADRLARRRRRADRRAGAAARRRRSIGSFFAENGSIDGAMTARRCAWHPAGRELPAREDVPVDAFDIRAAGTPSPRSECSFGESMPTWQRHTTCAPARRTAAARPAVCGSCSTTMSPASDDVEQLGDVALERLLVVRGVRSRRADLRRPACRRGGCASAS